MPLAAPAWRLRQGSPFSTALLSFLALFSTGLGRFKDGSSRTRCRSALRVSEVKHFSPTACTSTRRPTKAKEASGHFRAAACSRTVVLSPRLEGGCSSSSHFALEYLRAVLLHPGMLGTEPRRACANSSTFLTPTSANGPVVLPRFMQMQPLQEHER